MSNRRPNRRPGRRPSPEHQEAVSRRLALLSAELAAGRPDPEQPAGHDVDDWTVPHTRVRAYVDTGHELGDERGHDTRDGGPPVPMPGRHAARRTAGPLADSIPDTLRGRVALGPAQLAVVAVLVAVGLAVTCWWVVRADSGRLEAPPLTTRSPLVSEGPVSDASPVAGSPTGSPGGGPSDGTADGTVTVDVAGKVRRPGIVVLDAGARVVDALKAAGGARRGVDLSALNLARVLVDGEQILVGLPAPGGVAASAVPAPGAPGGPLVNLNTATADELEQLPEVGPVTAQAIVDWRDENGGFTSVDELLEVDGIGEATLGQMAPYVTV